MNASMATWAAIQSGSDWVHHLHGVPGEVDEHPLARRMHLAQRRLQPASPSTVEVAEPGIAKTVPGARPAAVFFPQERQCHVRPAQFAMHNRPIRHWPLLRRHVR
jgi:hypothetical protein